MFLIKKLLSSVAFTIACATFISCIAAFYNQYPLVYPDTGTYMNSGFMGEAPGDRPIFYGLFLRHISLHHSLWLVIVFQAFISSYIIYKTVDIFFEVKNHLNYLIIITLLSLLTGYSFNTSILIPDIFTSLSILCLINLWFNNKLSKYERILFQLIFVFSLITHFSTVLIILLLLLNFYLINYYRSKREKVNLPWRKINSSSLLVVVALFLIPFSNYLGGKKFTFSDSSHVFILNHLREVGLVTTFLEENCNETNNYKYCDYINDTTTDFIWDSNSPLYKTGGWENNREEYNSIIKGIIGNPNYWGKLITSSIQYTLKQLYTFKTEIHLPESKPGGPVYGQMEWRFPAAMEAYLNSKQNRDDRKLGTTNSLHFILALLSFILLIWLIFGGFSAIENFQTIRLIIILILLHNLINSFICSNLSLVIDRFQNRLIWLFPLFAVLILMKYFMDKKIKS